ncbi:hypothetical protein [Paenibacillus sp. GYB003]|uniref:hypothetical protein n=1 Tax=Paenibacillus sp. GYB003 TaxID=2994392 RepID=UPI002F9654EB
MINSFLEQLQGDVEIERRTGCLEQLDAATTRLQNVTRMWEIFGSDPLVQQMHCVVRDVVEAYFADFYELDLGYMEQFLNVPFCWFVRNHGTDFFPLEGEPEVMWKAEQWFHAVRLNYTDGIHVGSTQRLYHCDPKTKKMKRRYTFTGIEFRAIEQSSEQNNGVDDLSLLPIRHFPG